MWIVGAAIYQHSKSSGSGKDMWGWSCAQNTREEVFSNTVDYALLCRLQVRSYFHNFCYPRQILTSCRTGASSAPSSKSSSKFLSCSSTASLLTVSGLSAAS
jgi:hypothetical protein